MAKRKRLEFPGDPLSAGIETESTPPLRSRMPIATVAGDTAQRAALEEVTRALGDAERDGRLVKKIALGAIEARHLSRDRMVLDEADMDALKASIAARGQQTPVEVVPLGDGRYGLISGLRRLEALKALGETEALALVRRPESSEAAYVAMVEENEIRAGLSFYERANVVAGAVDNGLYSTPLQAVQALFARAPAPKRSKILSFVTLRDRLGSALRFPTAVPEKLGLALVAALEANPKLAARITEALRAADPEDAGAERRVLERALRKKSGRKSQEEVAPGVALASGRGRAVLSGPGVDAALLADLRAWLVSR